MKNIYIVATNLVAGFDGKVEVNSMFLNETDEYYEMGEQEETDYKAFNSYEIAEIFIVGVYFGYKLTPGTDRNTAIIEDMAKYKNAEACNAFHQGAILGCNLRKPMLWNSIQWRQLEY